MRASPSALRSAIGVARGRLRAIGPRAGAPIVACALALSATHAGATAQRTFVASTGTDANPCSLALPCRSFGAAIAQTSDRGEIIVLDSAGYGRVTITKSVTIAAPSGVYAGISVFSGTDGVTIDSPGVVVELRGLTINGQGGNRGINLVHGAELRIERCEVASMNQVGIFAQLAGGAAVYIRDTHVSRGGGIGAVGVYLFGAGRASLERVAVTGNLGTGIVIIEGPQAALREVVVERNGEGILIQGGTDNASATIDASRIYANDFEGVHMLALASSVVRATISDTDIVNNNQGAHVPSGGVLVDANASGAAVAELSMLRSRASYNHGAGLLATFPGAMTNVDNCVVTENTGFGLAAASGAIVSSRGTNTVENNPGGDLSNVTAYAGK